MKAQKKPDSLEKVLEACGQLSSHRGTATELRRHIAETLREVLDCYAAGIVTRDGESLVVASVAAEDSDKAPASALLDQAKSVCFRGHREEPDGKVPPVSAGSH